MDQIVIGNFGFSALLTLIVGVIYKFFERADGTSIIPEDWKTRIVILGGTGLGILSMFYNGVPLTTPNVTNYVISGLQTGFTSIGMWKGLGVVNTAGNAALAKINAVLAAKPPIPEAKK